MGKESLVELLLKIKNDKPKNVLKAYFVRKPSASKMYSYQHQISAEVQTDIIATVFPYIENQLEKATIVDYNPVGVAGNVKIITKLSEEEYRMEQDQSLNGIEARELIKNTYIIL